MKENWICGHAAAQSEGVGPMAPNYSGKTARTVFQSEAQGSAVRFIFEERYTKSPVTYDSITVLINGKFYPLTQKGERRIRIEAGERSVLDPVEVSVERGTDIELRTYTASKKCSASASSLKASYSLNGDHTVGDFPEAPVKNEKLSEVACFCGYRSMEVRTSDSDDRIAVAAFGDSITAGGRWVEPVRMYLREKGSPYMLMNMGINGNRLLHDTNTLMLGKRQIYGESGFNRLRRDVIETVDAKVVILALGINDIGEPSRIPLILPPLKELPTAAQLTDGLFEAVSNFRKNKIKVIGCTLTPFGGFKNATEKREEIRNDVNGWIRGSGVFDSVADFEAALADEGDEGRKDRPKRMKPEFDCGDHLHPNDAGGRAMAGVLIPALEQL